MGTVNKDGAFSMYELPVCRASDLRTEFLGKDASYVIVQACTAALTACVCLMCAVSGSAGVRTWIWGGTAETVLFSLLRMIDKRIGFSTVEERLALRRLPRGVCVTGPVREILAERI